MRIFFSFLFMVILILSNGWSQDIDLEKEKKVLQRTDWEFSNYIEKKGIIQAFLRFLSNKGIVLPRNGHPIIGKKSFQNVVSKIKHDDLKKFSKMEPLLVSVASSGDIGYTHGRYRLLSSNSSKDKKIEYGYYGSVWKKMGDQKWKIVFSQGLFLEKIFNKKPDDLVQKKKLSDEEKSLIKTELAFSKYSTENGIAQAFYNFMDNDGIALPSKGHPLKKESYQKLISQKPTKGWKTKLEWRPIFTDVASSGDIGFNFGPYQYTVTNPEGKKQSFFGYFMTVWKKQNDGSWKFVFDGGNQCSPPDNNK